MSLLQVDETRCRKDGFCVRVCPSAIIRMNKKTGFPDLIPRGEKGCIRCGHCVAVCPHSAMSHTEIPMDQCPPIHPELSISREQAVQFLRSRRSIRVFQDRQVERETIESLIDIARYAPTAANMQSIQWLAIADRSKARRCAELTIAHMRETIAVEKPATYAPYWPALVAAWDKGMDVVLRGAPAVIIAATPRGNSHGMTDLTLALSYLELAAVAMGLGTCWAGLLHTAMEVTSAFGELIPQLTDFGYHYPLMLGFPAIDYHRLPERRPPKIKWL